ncbi:MAG: hypothetical protein L6R37_008351 [Teloschistes peruensis]|nr:MAG: hypothetical protein L6R37_008351 [Teloschistes peruensis]
MPRFIQLLDCDFTLVYDSNDPEDERKGRFASETGKSNSNSAQAAAHQNLEKDDKSVAKKSGAKAMKEDKPDPSEYEGLGLEIFGAVNGRRKNPPWRRRVFRGKKKVKKGDEMGDENGKGGEKGSEGGQ